jgi:hypothetical protein
MGPPYTHAHIHTHAQFQSCVGDVSGSVAYLGSRIQAKCSDILYLVHHLTSPKIRNICTKKWFPCLIKSARMGYCKILSNDIVKTRTYILSTIFIVVPCILISSKSFIHQQMHYLLILEISKICIKTYIKIAPTCFSLRPSSGNLHLNLGISYICVKTISKIPSLCIVRCCGSMLCPGMGCVLCALPCRIPTYNQNFTLKSMLFLHMFCAPVTAY